MDIIDPLLLDFLRASIFCEVVQLLEDCRLFVHVGGKLTESLSVVDLWFLVGGTTAWINSSWISLDLVMMMGSMDGAALREGKYSFMVAHSQFTIG